MGRSSHSPNAQASVITLAQRASEGVRVAHRNDPTPSLALRASDLSRPTIGIGRSSLPGNCRLGPSSRIPTRSFDKALARGDGSFFSLRQMAAKIGRRRGATHHGARPPKGRPADRRQAQRQVEFPCRRQHDARYDSITGRRRRHHDHHDPQRFAGGNRRHPADERQLKQRSQQQRRANRGRSPAANAARPATSPTRRRRPAPTPHARRFVVDRESRMVLRVVCAKPRGSRVANDCRFHRSHQPDAPARHDDYTPSLAQSG